MAEQEFLHPDAHVFFNCGAVQNEPYVTAVIMPQLSLNSGLKKWGEKGRGEFQSEMKHLHMRDTFTPLNRKEFNKEQNNTILESHLLPKEKRYGILKGRTVAGGSKQRDFISKEDASSPTFSTK